MEADYVQQVDAVKDNKEKLVKLEVITKLYSRMNELLTTDTKEMEKILKKTTDNAEREKLMGL